MKQDTKKLIHRICSILLTVAIVASGLLLMGACLQIYLSGGEQIYTPEKVAAAFGRIAVPVYICLGLMAASFVLHLVLNPTKEKKPRTKHVAMELKRLRLTRDPAAADEEKKAALKKLAQQDWLEILCFVVGTVSLACFLHYATDGDHFTRDNAKITESIVAAMYVFVPCIAVFLGCCIVSVYRARRNMEKQIAILKQCPPLTQKPAVKKNRFAPVFRYVVLGLAVAFLVYGLVTGGWQDVLTKAVNICTECVGLG